MNENPTYYIDLITRYLSGETTEEEVRLLTAWLKADPKNEDIFRHFQKTWQLVEKQHVQATINTDSEWMIMESKLGSRFAETTTPLKVEPLNNNRIIIPLQRIWKVAASVTILMACSFLLNFYLSKPATLVVVAQAQNIEQILPDGSVVTLHAGSKLTYPEKFTASARKVELTGEAYFNVAHDKTKPFIVASGEARIEVLGTQFNVNANASSKTMEVVLTKGKVSVYYKGKPKDNIVLNPGEKAVLEPEQKQIRKSINTDPNYMAWDTHVLVFNNETLEQVIHTLQNVYQTSIRLADPQLAACRVTASFNDQSLASVLQVVQETLDLQVKQNENGISISGKACQ